MVLQTASKTTRRRFRSLVATYVIAVAIVATNVNFALGQASDGWPFVRGAKFDGHSDETGIVEEWPESGPPVLWVRKLGQGYSAFVAKGDRVYTQAQNMTGQYVYCLNGDTGETIWEYRYDWPYEAAGVYPGPRSTPTLADGLVYFTSPDGLLACLEQDTGARIWSVDLLETYGIEGCDFGYACSPTVVDGMVILPVGGKGAGIVAFDSRTGKQKWRTSDEPASYTPAFPIEMNGEPLVVGYMQNCVLILNRTSGKLRQKINLSRGYDEHSAWPIFQSPRLWLSAPFKSGSYVIDLSNLNDDAVAIPEVWRSELLSNDVCSSVCVDGFIYGFDIMDVQSKTHRPSRGIFRCIEFATGKEQWSIGTGRPRRDSNAAEFANDISQSGIVVADGKLIILNELGELILLKADPTQCVELARCSVLSGELTWTPPCLNNGRVYIRNQDRAVCVYLGDPKTLADVETLSIGDLPNRQYNYLAALLLAVEPEYAFDVPHDRYLLNWFFAGLAILVAGKLLAFAVHRGDFSRLARVATAEFLVVSILGMVGTTVLGRLTSQFVFAWHVCLFAAIEYAAIATADTSTPASWRQSLTRRIPLLGFLIVNVAYFLICRRLSLVFEWAFMIGYVGAIPVLLLMTRVRFLSSNNMFVRLAWSAVAYSFFFATVVTFFRWKAAVEHGQYQ